MPASHEPTYVYMLSVYDDSEFGQRVHRSCHVSHAAAVDYSDNIVLPGLHDTIDPEYHGSIRREIDDMLLMGACLITV